MSAQIKRIYGNDFFDRIHKQVDSIYKIDQPLIEKVKMDGGVDTNCFKYTVSNTTNDRIKIVSGYNWRKINNMIPRITNLFRVSIDRFSYKIVHVDTTQYEVSPIGYR